MIWWPFTKKKAKKAAKKTAENFKWVMLNGKKVKSIGSKREVFYGKALKTSKHSRLRRGDYMKNPHGKIVPKRKSRAAKKAFENHPYIKNDFEYERNFQAKYLRKKK